MLFDIKMCLVFHVNPVFISNSRSNFVRGIFVAIHFSEGNLLNLTNMFLDIGRQRTLLPKSWVFMIEKGKNQSEIEPTNSQSSDIYFLKKR